MIADFFKRFFFPASKEDLERFATKHDLQQELSKYATKEDLKPLATKEFVKEQVAELAISVGRAFEKQDTKMQEMEERILYEFHALAENIHQDVAGANKDEIPLIKDQKIPDHERRIVRLEERVGV